MSLSFPTFAAAQASNISRTSHKSITTLGYTVAGDGGGATYMQASSAPAQGGLKSVDGWWELVSTGEVNIAQFGALPQKAVFGASFFGTTMTVTAMIAGKLAANDIIQGAGLTTGALIRVIGQISGSTDGIGAWEIDTSQPSVDNVVVVVPASPISFSATFSGTAMTVSTVAFGTITAGSVVQAPGLSTGIPIHIIGQTSGSPGAAGVYTLDVSQPMISSITVVIPQPVFTATFAGTTMTVTAMTAGTIHIGDMITGNGLTTGTAIHVFSQTSGTTGGIGQYELDQSQPTITLPGIVVKGPPLIKFSANFPGGTNMNVTGTAAGIRSGDIIRGPRLTSSAPVTISSQTSGTPGGIGVYALSVSQPTILAPIDITVAPGACRDAIIGAQSYLKRRFGVGIVKIPAGIYYHNAGWMTKIEDAAITPLSNICYRGSGRSSTTFIFDDSESPDFVEYQSMFYNGTGSNYDPIYNTTFDGISFRGILDVKMSAHRAPVAINDGIQLTYKSVGILYSRGSGMTHINCEMTVVDFYGYGCWGGMISSRDCPNMIIRDFYIYGSQDDAISNHSTDTHTAPVRQGIVISNGILEESQGPTINGAKQLAISNLLIRRPLRKGLRIARAYSQTGNTSVHSITLNNIVITDLIRFARPAPFDDTTSNTYFGIGSGWRTTEYATIPPAVTYNKTFIGAPGRPDSSGNMVDLYGEMIGNYETNDTEHVPKGAGGSGIIAANIVLQRTLPNVSKASDWGFNPKGIFAPKWMQDENGVAPTLYYDLPVDDAMMNNYGLEVIPSLSNAIFSDTVIKATGDYGIILPETPTDGVTKVNLDNFGLDGVEFDNVRVSDVNIACAVFTGPAGTHDNVTFRNCVFDGDPLLRAQARGIANKAAWQVKAAFTASISGTTMTVSALASGKLLPGQLIFGPNLTTTGYVQIVSQSSGPTGGTGTYIINSTQSFTNKPVVAVPAVSAAFTALFSGKTMNVTAVTSGALSFNQYLYIPGTGIGNGIHVVSQLTGSPGGTGTYTIDVSVTRAETAVVGWANSGPVGIDTTKAGGFRFIGCQFRNVAQAIVESGTLPNFKQGNLVFAQPVGFGINPSNEGVGFCPNLGSEFTLAWDETDPVDYEVFGSLADSGRSVATAIPSSGFYAPGQFVSSQTPLIQSGKVLAGWQRLTFGNGQVAGTDWAAQYIPIS